MTNSYPYKQLPWYPHMKPGDVAIWNRFIAANPDAYESCLYDFGCGDAWPAPEGMQHDLALMWQTLCAMKIDVVAFRPDGIDCIELKPRAGHKAVGQALNYARMYVWDEAPELPVTPMIITDVELPNIRKLCDAHGIAFVVI